MKNNYQSKLVTSFSLNEFNEAIFFQSKSDLEKFTTDNKDSVAIIGGGMDIETDNAFPNVFVALRGKTKE